MPTSSSSLSKSLRDPRLWTVLAMVLIAAAMRLVPHPANFSPVAAMALFSGAILGRKQGLIAVAIPFLAMFVSDLVIGFHAHMLSVYGSMAAIALLGTWLKDRRTMARVGLGTFAGALLFFIVTNFSVWLQGDGYEKSWSGLVTCYAMAIPFFENTLAGDFIFALALFGAYALAERALPSLSTSGDLKAHG